MLRYAAQCSLRSRGFPERMCRYQPICNQTVRGSSPRSGSKQYFNIHSRLQQSRHGFWDSKIRAVRVFVTYCDMFFHDTPFSASGSFLYLSL